MTQYYPLFSPRYGPDFAYISYNKDVVDEIAFCATSSGLSKKILAVKNIHRGDYNEKYKSKTGSPVGGRPPPLCSQVKLI